MSSVHDQGPSVLMLLAGPSRRSRVEALRVDISTRRAFVLSMEFVEQFPLYYDAIYFPACHESHFHSAPPFCEWLSGSLRVCLMILSI